MPKTWGKQLFSSNISMASGSWLAISRSSPSPLSARLLAVPSFLPSTATCELYCFLFFGIDCIDFFPPTSHRLKNHSNRDRAMWTAAPWTVPPRILHSIELLWKPESNWQPGLNVINRRWRAKEKQTRETTQIKVHSRPRKGGGVRGGVKYKQASVKLNLGPRDSTAGWSQQQSQPFNVKTGNTFIWMTEIFKKGINWS